MRYVSSLNSYTSYDANVVLTQNIAADGGQFYPQTVPILLAQQLHELTELSFRECICRILGKFFPLKEVEENLMLPELDSVVLRERVILCQLWDRRSGSFSGTRDVILRAMECENEEKKVWASIATAAAMLFAFWAQAVQKKELEADEPFCISVSTDDFTYPAAAVYAAKMGLPVTSVIFTDREKIAWKLLHGGEVQSLSDGNSSPAPELELLFLMLLGQEEAAAFHYARMEGIGYTVPENKMSVLRKVLHSGVVSEERTRELIRHLYQSSFCLTSPETARAYSLLSEYRAVSGEKHKAMLLACESPLSRGTEVLDAMQIRKENVLIQIGRLEQTAKERREAM